MVLTSAQRTSFELARPAIEENATAYARMMITHASMNQPSRYLRGKLHRLLLGSTNDADQEADGSFLITSVPAFINKELGENQVPTNEPCVSEWRDAMVNRISDRMVGVDRGRTGCGRVDEHVHVHFVVSVSETTLVYSSPCLEPR